MKHLKRLGMGLIVILIGAFVLGAVFGLVKLLIVAPVVGCIIYGLAALYCIGLFIEIASY